LIEMRREEAPYSYAVTGHSCNRSGGISLPYFAWEILQLFMIFSSPAAAFDALWRLQRPNQRRRRLVNAGSSGHIEDPGRPPATPFVACDRREVGRRAGAEFQREGSEAEGGGVPCDARGVDRLPDDRKQTARRCVGIAGVDRTVEYAEAGGCRSVAGRVEFVMDVISLDIADVKLVTPRRLRDARGFFSEVYNRRELLTAGIGHDFVQDNHAYSEQAFTVRGLHFQRPPHAQTKLIRVARGRILDVTVDLRRGSVSYGRHVAVELSAQNWAQLLVPAGFAHGYCTLEPDTEVLYKVDAFYSAAADAGILWCDPRLGIKWPIEPGRAVVSPKDERLPRLEEIGEVFA
jgi:dTDP-4-dehydrorhamnose 3,5-epimerase